MSAIGKAVLLTAVVLTAQAVPISSPSSAIDAIGTSNLATDCNKNAHCEGRIINGRGVINNAQLVQHLKSRADASNSNQTTTNTQLHDVKPAQSAAAGSNSIEMTPTKITDTDAVLVGHQNTVSASDSSSGLGSIWSTPAKTTSNLDTARVQTTFKDEKTGQTSQLSIDIHGLSTFVLHIGHGSDIHHESSGGGQSGQPATEAT